MASETVTELKSLISWWQSHCDDAMDVDQCKESSEYAGIIVEVLFNDDMCAEMGMC